MRAPIIVCLLAASLLCAGSAAAGGYEEARAAAEQVVRAAKARAKAIPAQADALAELAWPAEEFADPLVATLAREQLVGFGDRGLDAMRRRVRHAHPRFSADIASAILETRLVVSSGFPPDYLPALEDVLWYGSSEAQRIAMFELARFEYRPGLLLAIDAAYENPELTCTVIRALGAFRDDRGRHYLLQQLHDGPERCRAEAAEGLAGIGGRALDTLREASLAARPDVRSLALDALLPITSVDDLTILYEYVAEFPEDDPERVERVTRRALLLEQLLEQQQQVEAATPRQD